MINRWVPIVWGLGNLFLRSNFVIVLDHDKNFKAKATTLPSLSKSIEMILGSDNNSGW